MNEARVRLIFHDSLGTRERQAALAGARAFERFGVICDCTSAGRRKELRQVKAGASLGSANRSGSSCSIQKPFTGWASRRIRS